MLQSALLPLCTILIKRGQGAGELIEAAKVAYLHAAIREIVPQGSRVNMSRLAVATGLTRREIAALLRRKSSSVAPASSRKTLQQRALRVLQGWSSDYAFRGPAGAPSDLPLRGPNQSFSQLVKRYGGDVTPVSVLRELERMKAVTVLRTGKVKYRKHSLQSQAHKARQLAEFARLFRDFANAVQKASEPRDAPSFFGFKDSTVASPHQAALFQRTFSKRAAALLESIDQWAAHQAKAEKGKRKRGQPQSRVGLGIYLVHDEE